VFQDTIVFNLTLRENIAFSKTVKDEDLESRGDRRVEGLVDALPGKLDTVVSERAPVFQAARSSA